MSPTEGFPSIRTFQNYNNFLKMNLKKIKLNCHLATLFYEGVEAQANRIAVETDCHIDYDNYENYLDIIGDIKYVDNNYLDGLEYTLTKEDKEKIFYVLFKDIKVDINELAYLIASLYHKNEEKNIYHCFGDLYLEGITIEDNIIRCSIGS